MSEVSETPHGDLLVILRHAPHGSLWLREALDLALVGAAFGQSVSLLLMGDGVWALLQGQGSGPLGQKGTQSTFEMLEMYDIERLYIDIDALEARGLTRDDLLLPVIEVPAPALSAVLAGHRQIVNF
ncbi:tRNA 2-thiouridine synthesizing protein C [Chromohalobacter marismortui]|uniref:tRNA 2-thiouridine synthesizing protein C n=1 Tax=Chromohalobacter marismortui TaxID=42055 RepID=A0A4R7NPD8_9GAMM|nr:MULTISPECIES: sulfurtransferase complex subunit TusC [Chromohalobacter]MCI0508892.1 sulfurtransferase complex subunit TusC [Chromohalobacter sp.]MCI0594251.1 sulfurtransferase complex subunit TusC [Chromohalobacter sp.]TDU22733.1 tRNA 2-thiouridine synthesizing protein C [Chromohalobacter marismortui]